jgi:hypothetical protein
MRPLKWITYSLLLVLFVSIFCKAESQAPPRRSQCFSCHTNPGKLIKITRELAKDPDYRPSKSALIKGEG